MALNQFPYTNFHELNGDYVLQTVQQASQDAIAASQAAQNAAAQVAGADQKATEALARATIANNTADSANQKADTALTRSQAAQNAAQAAADDALTAQGQAQIAQTAAQAARASASAAEQSANAASADAAEAVQTLEEALETIPTARTMNWQVQPNSYIIGSSASTVGAALDIAYPRYIEFTQVGTTNQFQATVTPALNVMVLQLVQGMYIDAVIYFTNSTRRIRARLTHINITDDTIHMAWMAVQAAGGDAEILVMSMDCLRSASSNLTGVMYWYNLSPLEV